MPDLHGPWRSLLKKQFKRIPDYTGHTHTIVHMHLTMQLLRSSELAPTRRGLVAVKPRHVEVIFDAPDKVVFSGGETRTVLHHSFLIG